MNARTILWCLAWCLGAAAPGIAGPETLPRYAETVWMNADGSAHVDVDADLPAGTSSPVRLPLAFAEIAGLTVSGVDRASVAVVSEAGQRYLSIAFPAALATPMTVRLSGDVPRFFAALTSPPKAFGNRTLTYRFLNSTASVFRRVDNQVVLPAGYVVQSVEDSEPAATESSTAPPYIVMIREGRQAVRIAVDNVRLGDAASVTFRFKERAISALVPLALLAISIAYLVGFRSLTTRSDTSP